MKGVKTEVQIEAHIQSVGLITNDSSFFFSYFFLFLGKKQHVITSCEKLPYPSRELMFLLQWKKWKGEKVITPFRTQDNIYYTYQ